MSAWGVLQHGGLGPGDVGLRHAGECQRQRFDDEVVDRDLEGRFSVPVLRGRSVDLLAQGQERVELAIRADVEMRDGLLGLAEAARNGLAHVVVRLLGEGAGREHLLDRLVRGGCRLGGRGCLGRSFRNSGRGGRSLGAAAGERCLHVAFHHAAMRAGAGDRRQVEVVFLGNAPGERRREGAGAAIVAVGNWRGLAAAHVLHRRRPLVLMSHRHFEILLGRGFARRRRLLDLGLGLRGRSARCRARVLAFRRDHADNVVHRHIGRAVRHHDLGERALIDRLDLHRGLVGLDLGDDVARLDGVTLLLEPAREIALLHGGETEPASGCWSA